MTFFTECKLAINNLSLHKTRSLLTMLGMVFGVGSVMAILAVGEGANQRAMDLILALGENNILVTTVKPVENSNSHKRVVVNNYGLTFADAQRIKQSYLQVSRVVPVRFLRERAWSGGQLTELRLVGTTPDWFQLVDRPLLSGRKLFQVDMDKGKNVVVLTEYIARRLLAGRNRIGERVRIGSAIFTVVGIIKSRPNQGGDMQAPDREEDAYIPLTTLRGRFGDIVSKKSAGSRVRERVELHGILVQVGHPSRVEPVAAAIASMLLKFHSQNDYRLQVPLALLRQAEETKRTFNVVLGSIAAISLLVGGIGIMNIMLASVMERTKEIGILRAIGAKRYQIIRQFLIETVVISVTGGICGIVLGLFIPKMITHMSGMVTITTPFSLFLALFVSMVVGIIFGIYPAMRASALNPVVALRQG